MNAHFGKYLKSVNSSNFVNDPMIFEHETLRGVTVSQVRE